MAATLVGRWRPDGDGSDATGYARTAAPTAGVAWAEDRDLVPFSSAGLAGADSLTTAGPVLRTDQFRTAPADADGQAPKSPHCAPADYLS